MSREPHVPSEVPMCEAPILPSLPIHPSAQKWESPNIVVKVGHLGIKLVSLLLIFVMNAAKFIADSFLPVRLGP